MKNEAKTHKLYSFGSNLGNALGQIWKTFASPKEGVTSSVGQLPAKRGKN